MGGISSQITSLTIVYSTVYSDADHRKHQSSASLVFVQGIHRWPVNSLHKWPVTRKMFPFVDVIMLCFFPQEILVNLVSLVDLVRLVQRAVPVSPGRRAHLEFKEQPVPLVHKEIVVLLVCKVLQVIPEDQGLQDDLAQLDSLDFLVNPAPREPLVGRHGTLPTPCCMMTWWRFPYYRSFVRGIHKWPVMRSFGNVSWVASDLEQSMTLMWRHCNHAYSHCVYHISDINRRHFQVSLFTIPSMFGWNASEIRWYCIAIEHEMSKNFSHITLFCTHIRQCNSLEMLLKYIVNTL